MKRAMLARPSAGGAFYFARKRWRLRILYKTPTNLNLLQRKAWKQKARFISPLFSHTWRGKFVGRGEHPRLQIAGGRGSPWNLYYAKIQYPRVLLTPVRCSGWGSGRRVPQEEVDRKEWRPYVKRWSDKRPQKSSNDERSGVFIGRPFILGNPPSLPSLPVVCCSFPFPLHIVVKIVLEVAVEVHLSSCFCL